MTATRRDAYSPRGMSDNIADQLNADELSRGAGGPPMPGRGRGPAQATPPPPMAGPPDVRPPGYGPPGYGPGYGRRP